MKKLKNKQAGFGAVELILVLVIVVLLGVVGWFVYDRSHNKTSTSTTPTTSTNTSSSTKATTPVKQTTSSTKQTVTYKTAKFSFDLPKDWSYTGAPSSMGTDEFDAYVVSPDKKIQLSIYIQKISDWTGSSVSNGPYQASFTGIGGKTYYLEEVEPQDGVKNQISVSACGPNACKTLDDHTTKLNDTYWLNLAIDPGSKATPPYNLSVKDPLVTQIKTIIHSITIQ